MARSKEEILIEKVGEFWWICGKHKPEFLEAMDAYASEVLRDFAQRFYADEEACRNNVENFFKTK